jgi:hypothetical protein
MIYVQEYKNLNLNSIIKMCTRTTEKQKKRHKVFQIFENDIIL